MVPAPVHIIFMPAIKRNDVFDLVDSHWCIQREPHSRTGYVNVSNEFASHEQIDRTSAVCHIASSNISNFSIRPCHVYLHSISSSRPGILFYSFLDRKHYYFYEFNNLINDPNNDSLICTILLVKFDGCRRRAIRAIRNRHRID